MLLTGAMAQGATSDLRFRHFSTEDGLSSDCIRDIMQDDRGYMWFATDGGVCRFDGHNVTNYVLRSDGDGTHDTNFPLALHQGNGTLWVGTDLHLFRYDPVNDRFDMVPLSLDGKVKELNITSLASDRDGNLWIAAEGDGILQLPAASTDFSAIRCTLPQVDNRVSDLMVDSRNDVWAVSNQRQGGVFKLDKHEGKFRPMRLTLRQQPLSVQPAAIAEDDNHRLWIANRWGRLYSFDGFSGDAVEYVPTTASGTRLSRIHSIVPLGDNRLMIGSDTGLGIYDWRNDQLNVYRYDATDPYSLSGQFVYPITLDHEGGVWIGTFYGGVNYLMPDLKKFVTYSPSNSRNSVTGNVISAFLEDSHGNIYIASDDGGLNRFNPSTETFTTIALGQGGDNIHALMLDGADLWVGSFGEGVYRYNTLTGHITNYRHDEHDARSLPDNNSYAMLRDAQGAIYIAAGDNLARYDRARDDFDHIRDLGAQIIDIDQDAKGVMWIATQGKGLFSYDPVTDSWKNYRSTGADGDLAHNHVNNIEIDNRRNIWVATSGGLSHYLPDTDTFETIDIGFPDPGIMSVVEDQGTLWVATQHGLVHYSPDMVDVYTMADGLTSSQFMPGAIIKSSSGRIYVGSRRGFNAFMPYQVQSNQTLPSLVFTGIEIDNHPVDIGDVHLPREINSLDELVLRPADNYLTIGFASLSYVNPDKNQYQYMLEGFDKEWTLVGNQNRAVYTNLPAGSYTFKVKASNSDNVWNDNPIALRIKVLPPWYARWYMQVLYALLICAALAAGIMLLYRRNEAKHQAEISQINSNKEIEVYQAKLSFFTMIAHEIRTPVTLIIGPIEKMMRHASQLSPAMSKDLSVVDRNSQRLLYLVNQLLDFKKVEETELHVEYRPTDIVALVKGVLERFVPTLEQKGIALELNVEVADGFTADIDAEAVTKMVSNLMNNARKFTRDRITVTISADTARDTFTISVADNGIGVSKDNQRKIFVPFYQVTSPDSQQQGGTGIGLSIVKGVVEAHGGSIDIDSDYGKGATMIATMPIHQANVVVDEVLPEEQTVAQPEVASPSESERPVMLVVDDNEELCTFIANNFDDKYQVLTAENGVEALQTLRDHDDISLIISDWMMPKMDGVELCRAVRADRLYSHIPFVLLTAKTDNHSKIEGLNCGADAYVEKPFSVQVLEARINNLLQMREMLRAKFSGQPLEPIQSIASTPVDNDFLTRLNEIIEENFSNPDLSVDLIAEKMDISRSSLYAKIKSLADVTPNDLIKIARLKKAAQLLAEGRYRINEVCYMVGFNSPSYFAKCFAKQFGMTPGDFHP